MLRISAVSEDRRSGQWQRTSQTLEAESEAQGEKAEGKWAQKSEQICLKLLLSRSPTTYVLLNPMISSQYSPNLTYQPAGLIDHSFHSKCSLQWLPGRILLDDSCLIGLFLLKPPLLDSHLLPDF